MAYIGNEENECVWDKFILICKPEQSGKTFIMIKMINESYNNYDDEGKIIINFIFCDNNLLLTKQTSERIKRDVKLLPDTSESYVEFSSRKDGIALNLPCQVENSIAIQGITNIVCCTNGKRVENISSIINTLNRAVMTKNKFIFRIWLDEADKFVNHISKSFFPLVESNDNVEVYCITATPDTLFKKYNYMNVLPLAKTTNRKQYHGWKDNIIKIRENIMNTTCGFVTQALLECNPEPKSKWYIPAERTVESHQEIRDILLGSGFAVFVVNGAGIELSLPLPGKQVYIEKKTKELQEQIREMYKKYDVEQFPTAVTGNLCVGRGISIMHPEFIFDYGILSNCTKKTEVSQNAGRLKGNIKKWENYKPPTVYTTAKFDSIATEWEIRSRELAILAFNKSDGDIDNPVNITKSEFKNIGKECDWNSYTHEFTDIDDAHKYLKENGFNRKRKFEYNPEGFIVSSTTGNKKILSYDEVKAEIAGWSATSALDMRGKDKAQRMIVCYKDLNDKKSVVYIIRAAYKK